MVKVRLPHATRTAGAPCAAAAHPDWCADEDHRAQPGPAKLHHGLSWPCVSSTSLFGSALLLQAFVLGRMHPVQGPCEASAALLALIKTERTAELCGPAAWIGALGNAMRKCTQQ